MPVLIVLLALFMVTNSVFARIGDQKSGFPDIPGQSGQQKKSVTGKVTDATGASLPGVSVVVKGTTNGVITDSNGKYTLANTPENATLQFSFVGMKAQEIAVGGKSTINVSLVEESIGIEEVVAIGYGTQKKVNLTGAVSVANKEALADRPVATVQQAIQGLVPGLTLSVGSNGGEPGGGMNMTLRGYNRLEEAVLPMCW